jgi:TBC1 domain family member 13
MRECVQELQRLLFVFSKLNSGLKYVQGMNELVAPLYLVFKTEAASVAAAAHAEADTFFCFIRVLTVSENRDLYCKTLDTAASGVKHVMQECACAAASVCMRHLQSCAHSWWLSARPRTLP